MTLILALAAAVIVGTLILLAEEWAGSPKRRWNR